ncbi:hypothetical protein CDD83_8231 [Cordyceps sp. RAO-2017]|nr:hypothetical protein CDD83_8231 [Cordyceps sp. RAO-2017]
MRILQSEPTRSTVDFGSVVLATNISSTDSPLRSRVISEHKFRGGDYMVRLIALSNYLKEPYVSWELTCKNADEYVSMSQEVLPALLSCIKFPDATVESLRTALLAMVPRKAKSGSM